MYARFVFNYFVSVLFRSMYWCIPIERNRLIITHINMHVVTGLCKKSITCEKLEKKHTHTRYCDSVTTAACLVRKCCKVM